MEAPAATSDFTVRDAADYLRTVIEPLCAQPEALIFKTAVDEKGALISLFAHREDLGRVIGKKGETANGIRSILRALGTKHNARYSFKVDSLDKADQ